MKPISSWVNLQDMLGVNRDEGARMNDAVYGDLEQTGAKARGALRQAERGFESASNQALRGAQKQMGSASSAQAEASGGVSYGGPRSLNDTAPGLGKVFADAASRIGTSKQAAFGAHYARAGAQGGAFDQALMQRAGGDSRWGQLQRNYGGLIGEFGGAQQRAYDLGDRNANTISAEAARLAALAPQLRADEEARAGRAAHQKALEEFERKQAERNRTFNQTRGNEIQAAYAADFPYQDYYG